MKPVDEIEIEERKGRFFAKTDDRFDGTANGYGYKSKQSLLRARWYFLNKPLIEARNKKARAWLKAHPEAKSRLNSWLEDMDYWLYDAKDGGDGPSLGRFFSEHEEEYGDRDWFLALKGDEELGEIVWRWVFDG